VSARSNAKALRGLERQERGREALARQIAKAHAVPDHPVGIRSPWYRRVWQARTRRP
jgi:hypothetical protein